MLIAAVGFGTLSLSARRLGALDVTALPYVLWRSLLGGVVVMVVFAGLMATGRARWPASDGVPRNERLALLAAGLLGAVINLAMFTALERSTVALTLITFYTYPALTTLGATRTYGEPIDRQKGASLILASAGLALVVLAPLLSDGGIKVDALAVGLALTAAVGQAIFLLVAGRGFSSVPSVLSTAIVMLIGGAVFAALVLGTGQLPGAVIPFSDAATWPWIFMTSIVGAAVPTVALLVGTRRIGPGRTSILMMAEPVVGVVIAGLFLAEQPAPLQLVGGAAVIAAGILLQFPVRAPALPIEAPAQPV